MQGLPKMTQAGMAEAILAMNTGGLANRVQNVESCLLLARAIDVPLRIIWVQNKQLATPFHHLFEAPEGATVIEGDTWPITKEAEQEFGADLVADWNDDRGLQGVPDARVIEIVSQWRRPSIKLFSRFFTSDIRRQSLTLAPSVASAVSEAEHLARGRVGVHIRRGDHKGARAQSPDFSFLFLLDNLTEDREVFLCTDDASVEELLIRRYPGRVHLRPKSTRDRKDGAAAIEALVDLALLSRTDAIIGSVGSTFGHCAAHWGNLLIHHARSGT